MKLFFNYFLFQRYWILVLCFLGSSCMPDPLEVKEIPNVEEEIIVATQMLPDGFVIVWLTKSFGALQLSEESNPEELLDQIIVEDAVVSITGPDGAEELSLIDKGFYGGYQLPYKAGTTYELHVLSKTLGEVKATTRVQSQVKFQEVETIISTDIYDDTLAEVSYSFHDPVEKNWYMLNVQKFKSRNFTQNLINPEYATLLLDDKDFNGQFFENKFEFFAEGYQPGDTLSVSLSNISEEYYQFMKLRTEKGLGFKDFFGAPVNYPTNVEGGKGFFHLHVPDIRPIVLEMEE